MRHAFVIENHPSKDVRPPNCPRVYLLTLLTQTRPVKRVRLINAPSTPSYTQQPFFLTSVFGRTRRLQPRPLYQLFDMEGMLFLRPPTRDGCSSALASTRAHLRGQDSRREVEIKFEPCRPQSFKQAVHKSSLSQMPKFGQVSCKC